MTLVTGRPRVRAMLLDARRERPSPTPLVVALTSVGTARKGRESVYYDRAPFGACLVESSRYEILVEQYEAHTPTRARVDRGRGIDVAIVIAGQKNGIASRDLKLLHACGCRRALLLVPPDVPDVVVENLGRHLLLGARFDADEMPVHQLGHDPEELTADDARALVDAVDACAVPAAAGTFLAAIVASGQRVDVARGALVPDVEAWMHTRVLNDWQQHVTTWRAHPDVVAAGDDAPLAQSAALREGLLAHEPLSFVREIDLEGTFRSDDVREMCFAFGGNAGFSEGHIHRGRVTLSEPIAPYDNRVGLVRFQGAGLGPVQSIALDATRTVVDGPQRA